DIFKQCERIEFAPGPIRSPYEIKDASRCLKRREQIKSRILRQGTQGAALNIEVLNAVRPKRREMPFPIPPDSRGLEDELSSRASHPSRSCVDGIAFGHFAQARLFIDPHGDVC